ncbi:MAG TPA: S-layer homology domain-containing protein [Symbiobacteriaceae bacterium]|nr:S-layer homology domain-containing protein [Symbiobacteriaceae bacterium]
MARPALFLRRAVGLLVLMLLLLATQPAGALFFREATPRGSVGISRPPIQQQFYLGAGESIRSARLWLDGNRVEPTWDADGLVSYVPPAPLAAGTHTVRLIVEIAAASDRFVYDPLVSEFTFTVAGGAISMPPLPGPEELRALQQVNGYRKAAGLDPLVYNAALGAAARGHARYLSVNPEQKEADAHGETPGWQLFFGQSPLDRAAFYGYGGGTGEVINFTDRAEEAVAGWMETIYHRIPLVHPGNRVMGYGLAGSGDALVNVLEAGPGQITGGAVVWPHPDQTNVPTGWDGLESPDPLRLYPGAAGPVGYTVTLTFGGDVRSLSLSSWSLNGPAGGVPTMVFSPANDSHLEDTVALIPYEPLTPGARYTVTMAGQVDLGTGPQRYSRTWSFTTAPEHTPAPRRMTTTTLGGVLTRVAVEGTGFGQGMNAFLGGLPVRNLQVLSGSRITFEPPAGLPYGEKDLVLVTPGGREVRWGAFLEAGAVEFPEGGPLFSEAPVAVHGVTLPQPALITRDGRVLLPEAALAELGAARTDISEIGRRYWTWAGRSGDYVYGRLSATVAEIPFTLSLPVQGVGGRVYVEREFLSRLTLEPVGGVDGRYLVGMQDIGAHWARPQIIQLMQAGIVSGVGAGQFRPGDTLTRAAFVKMLAGARKLPLRPTDAGTFSDTAQHWVAAQGYIGAAVQAGIVVPAEYPGGKFQPDLAISREEMAVMVTRALGKDAEARSRKLTLTGGTASVAGRSFTDAATWTKPGYIAVAIEQGIITGYPEDGGGYTYRPFRQATRAEAVVMIVRTLDK